MRLIDDADVRRRIIAFATGLHSAALPVDTVMMLLTQVPTIDAVPVVRCGKCVLHGNCITEDTFRLAGIENPFCCAGKRKEGADHA